MLDASIVMYAPSAALASCDRTEALDDTSKKSGPAQTSTTMVSMPSQVTSKRRHMRLKRQRASLAMADHKDRSFCGVSVDVEDAMRTSLYQAIRPSLIC